jgi:hypothetical protein
MLENVNVLQNLTDLMMLDIFSKLTVRKKGAFENI